VVIDAQIVPSRNGGTASALSALVRALGRLRDGDEWYAIAVGNEEQVEYWRPCVGANQALVYTSEYKERAARARPGGDRPRWKRQILEYVSRALKATGETRAWPEVPISDGFYESLGCDVLHLPWQHFRLCAMPTVYNPHDLQHRHFPQFFSTAALAYRETVYPAGCHFAQTVVVGSRWAKDDVVRQYRIDPEKIQIIPEGPPTQLDAAFAETAAREVGRKYGLPEGFILYPAMAWPHKNHLRLLEALAHLRDTRGLVVPLVCTGGRHDFWSRIERRIQDLQLSSQVKFLGFVTEEELRGLQRLARCLVIPSLFEASSLPIFDAWLEGLPVACSRVAALPDQVKDAAVLFDPLRVESIAEGIAAVVTDGAMQDELRARGYRRVKDFDWERTARCYRAVYRRVAGMALNEEDRWLLAWDWMREPERTREETT
jgi:glycosyltransferase involved in cell wall biosynthesis